MVADTVLKTCCFQCYVSSDWESLLLCTLSALCYNWHSLKWVSFQEVFEGPGFHWCSILSYPYLFLCVFFAEVSFQVFWPLVIYLYGSLPALASKCRGYRNAAPCPANLTFLPPLPSFFISCLSSLWLVSLNIVSSLDLHSLGCILFTDQATKTFFILLRWLPSFLT